MDNDESPRARGPVFKIAAGLGLVALVVLIWLVWGRSRPVGQVIEAAPYQPVPVPANSGDIPEGFRGSVHPLLRPMRKNVEAHWSELGVGRDQLEKSVPPEVYALFAELKPAACEQVYTERDFSVFMPAS